MGTPQSWNACPVGLPNEAGRISLMHGEGGGLARRLIERTILPRLGATVAGRLPLPDAAHLPDPGGRLAFTTDSFVVSPLFFPGGDIGRLAVFGTVNDLVVSGAEPRWLSLSLIIEEGFPVASLEQVLDSIAEAARVADIEIVAGDTKVVPHGAADGLFLNTSGIGRVLNPCPLGPASIQEGDTLIVSGPIGRHGLAILAAREELSLHPPLESDCACLWPLVNALHRDGMLPHVRAMRDATRGGVVAVLHEWSAACQRTLSLDELRIPVTPDVRGASELLGLDPLYIANEGTMLLAVEAAQTEAVIASLRAHPVGRQATRIGVVQPRGLAPVISTTATGSARPLDETTSMLLPRIC